MKFIFTLAASAICVSAFSQSVQENYHFASAFFGNSIAVLGSSQIRYGGGISYGTAQHEPRFDCKYFSGQIVYEGYYDHTRNDNSVVQNSDALGILFYARWFARMPSDRPRPFLDFGWGFQYADRPTIDLPSEINSTPVGAVGYSFPISQGHQLLLSLRFLHISNAGFVKPNRGQDELFLTAGVTF